MSQPTIVLIPGAWHGPQHFTTLINSLKDLKFDVITQALPSLNPQKPHEQSVANDAKFIRQELLLPVLGEGKNVILLMHSYGGIPGADAAKGLSKTERQSSGEKGGIVELIFICAFLTGEGESLSSKIPEGQGDSWAVPIKDTALLTVNGPKAIFYNDVDDETAEWAVSLLLPQAASSLDTPSGPPAWQDSAYDCRRTYIQTTMDKAFPFVGQDAMVKYSGVEWDVVKLESGHSPFLNHSKELVDVVSAKVKAHAS
ncbi:unnamed protein product [Periconia digitata]|uniref:AB hydrolase-1 domain-containing protein n=1 Tax=Periconia digitata TaxID=1303443 RepID=A0A9W4U4X8_9PLEO|nr:unnamed protein product [Periconia digitata]